MLTWLHWRLSDFTMLWLWPASRYIMGYTWPSLYEEFTEAQREDIRGFKRVVERWPDDNNRASWLRMFTRASEFPNASEEAVEAMEVESEAVKGKSL